MARWLRRLALLCTVAGFVGAWIALMTVWMAPDQFCAWKECLYNGLYPPPPPPRTETIQLVVGRTLPFGAYWLLFVAILIFFAAGIYIARFRPRHALTESVISVGALALLFLDTRLPSITWWTHPYTTDDAGGESFLPPASHSMTSRWLFLWCFAPCCLAIIAQYFSSRLSRPHPLPPSPTGEGESAPA